MPEEKNIENETPKEEIVYATPMKRVWAWVGVVYMVLLVLLMTYGLASGGYLNGIGPLMLSPPWRGWEPPPSCGTAPAGARADWSSVSWWPGPGSFWRC